MTSFSADDLATAPETPFADYAAAMEQLPASTQFSASSLQTIYAMACNFLQAGQRQRASDYFSFLLNYAPTNPDFLCARAGCAMQADDPALAVELLSLALYVQPESCSIALALAEALVRAGALKTARQMLLLVCRSAELPADAIAQARAELLLQALPSDAAPHAA